MWVQFSTSENTWSANTWFFCCRTFRLNAESLQTEWNDSHLKNLQCNTRHLWKLSYIQHKGISLLLVLPVAILRRRIIFRITLTENSPKHQSFTIDSIKNICFLIILVSFIVSDNCRRPWVTLAPSWELTELPGW